MLKKEKKPTITKKQKEKCHAIIHSFSAGAGGVGAGLAQVPLSDTVVLTGTQVAMIVSLGKVFGLKVSESAASAIGKSVPAALIGRSITQVLWGWIPVVGNAINATTAAGLTELIGWWAVKEFSENPGKYEKISPEDEENEESKSKKKERDIKFDEDELRKVQEEAKKKRNI